MAIKLQQYMKATCIHITKAESHSEKATCHTVPVICHSGRGKIMETEINLLLFFVVACYFGGISRNHCQIQSHKDLSPGFSSRNLIILVFTLMLLIHFELICINGLSLGFKIILLQMDIHFSQHHLFRLFMG